MVMQRLQDIGLPVVEYYTTNLRLMIPATAKVFDAVTEKKLRHDGNAALSRHLDNCVLKVDAKGPRVTKESSHSKRKIDNAIAFIVAYDRATARLEEEEVLVPGFYY
jgi:phage terminase large subunit-like protein